MKFSKFMLLGALGVALLTATSCGTPKDVAYFQDLNNNPDTVITLQNKVITVKPTDKSISVSRARIHRSHSSSTSLAVPTTPAAVQISQKMPFITR